MVEIFNQLTHSEVEEHSLVLFKEILGNHFEKFRYYHSCIEGISDDVVNKVKGISCFCSDKGILIEMVFKSTKGCKNYLEAIEEEISIGHPNAKYFNFSVKIDSGKKLNISIENKNISREDEIYEDRFDSY